ncbi:MAG: hypothetical protein WCI65_01390 [Synechococcaceae cyanobacterium ELA263]
MIVLKITNASEFMAAKVGKFLESLTPDAFDQTTVEDILMRKLIENLQAQGLEGEIAAVNGLDLKDKELILQDKLHVRSKQNF